MKAMKFALSVFATAVVSLGAAAATGESWKSPGSLAVKSTATAYTLVNEKNLDWTSEDDPEDKYYGTGAYYLKFTVTRGKAYTLTVKTVSSEEELGTSLDDISSYDFDKEVYLPGFESDQDPDGTVRYTLYADEWETGEDPHDKSGVFYLYVYGAIGDKCSVQLQEGEIPYVKPQGTYDDPVAISSISTTAATVGGTIVDESLCYFQIKLSVGKRYKFWTTDGTEEHYFSVGAEGAEGVEEPKTYSYEDGVGTYDGGVVVTPTQTGNHLICVEGVEYGDTFTLHYQQAPVRKIAKHPVTVLKTTAAFEPGYRNNPASGYYDQIIDDDLFKVTLTSGKYYKFWTDGAATNLVMELYDASGNVLLTNKKGFPQGYDCCLVYKAASSATYYIGVCQDIGEDDTLAEFSCTINMEQVTTGQLDAWDNGDDKLAGASAIVPALQTTLWATGEAHGPHTLGATDWTDSFAIACRNGATYRVGTELTAEAVEGMADLKLSAIVYAPSKKTTVSYSGDLSAGGCIKFKATENGTYYVKVSVSDGQGIDYGPYVVKCAVSQPGTEWGYLDVSAGGLSSTSGATWYIAGESATYPLGRAAMPVGTYTVAYSAVKGWSAPAGGSVTVKAGETSSVYGKYSDTYDHGDDTIGGAVEIAPKKAGLAVSRSLWTDDPADWMKFKTVIGYYTFSLDGGEKCGDATVTVYSSDGATVLGQGTSVEFSCAEIGKYYYAAVTHGQATTVDSQYVLTATCVQTGAVGFEKETYSVKNDAASLTVNVTRAEGSEGTIVVRYHTQSGEGDDAAVAGEDYEPVKGTLTWEDGDATAKTITIPLLPQLTAEYATDREFGLKLEPVDEAEEELEEGTYAAFISRDSASVTIATSVAANPGTLQFAGTSDDDTEEGPTSESLSATVKAGAKLRLWFSRTGGADGNARLVVNTKDGTAEAGENYTAITKASVNWSAGDAELKYLDLETKDLETAYQESVKLTVNLSISTKVKPKATLGTKKTLTVTIVDPNATSDFSSFQKTCASMDGVTVSATGTWYFDESAQLTHVPLAAKKASATLTYTLVGPGQFTCYPQFDDGGKEGVNTATYSLDGGTAQAVDGSLITLDIASGTHTLVFKAYRGAKLGLTPQMTFMAVDEDMPFGWEPVRAGTVVAPLAGELVGQTPTLRWADACEGVTYRLTVGTKLTKKGNISSTGLVFRDEEIDGTSYTFESELAAGKTYYWRLDTVGLNSQGGEVVVKSAVQSFTTASLAGGATLKTLFRAGSVDATGEVIEAPEDGLPYEVTLVQGLDATMKLANSNAVSGATVRYALVNSKTYPLPTGLSVTAKGTIQGWPTVAGTYTTLLQATETEKSGTVTKGETLKVEFTVEPQELAAGTFAGLVSSEDERLTQENDAGIVNGLAAAKIGSLSLTVAASPKARGKSGADKNLTATIKIAGKEYVFTQSCWTKSEPELDDCGLPGLTAEFVNITQAERTVKSQTYYQTVTNRLTITTTRGEASEQAALDRAMDVQLVLTLASSTGKSFVTDIEWAGEALRNNTAEASVKEQLAPFAGYYTVALAPTEVLAGDNTGVTGRGYLTMTVAEDGAVKYAGKLGDGATAVSGSAVASYISEETSISLEPEVLVPVYQGSAKFAFGGWIRLAMNEDGVAYVVSANIDDFCKEQLTWLKADYAASYSGKGFVVEHEAVGGYYNTVVNLQRYYYDQGLALTVPGECFTEFSWYFSYLLGDYDYLLAYPGVAEGGVEGQVDLTLAGNSITAPTKSLVYREDDTSLVDWIKSTNPCDLSFKFTRGGDSLDATGVYTGNAATYKGDSDVPGEETTQSYLKKCAIRGVLLLTRDGTASAISEDEVAPGALFATLLAPDEDEEGNETWTRSVKTSVPFAVRAVEKTWPWQEPDWTEGFEAGE